MSRFAVIHFAGRAGDHNDRAMSASPALADALADATDASVTMVGVPARALNVGWQEELEVARPALDEMARRIDAAFSSGGVPVTALSRCAVALATLPVVARHRPDAVVVWFDAHADINTPSTTTSDFLGGLAFSGPLGLWESGLGSGVTAANAILAGVRDIDEPERALIDRGAVTLVEPGPDFAARLSAAVAGRPVYVHIDCDVLIPGVVPTDYQVPGGLSLDDLQAASVALAANEIVGVEIAELESGETPAVTADAARRLVAAVLPLLGESPRA